MEDFGGIPSALPDLPLDLLGLITSRVGHRDLCILSATCRKLRSACSSDKLWLPQCQRLAEGESIDLNAWRSGMESHRALYRFLAGARPLLGIWVHQNPELGNLVYVTWGFLSIIGCRIIPQELGPRGMERGLLWAPVFEVIGAPDGSLAFFLHGRDKEDWCYPGRVEPAREGCNVLMLEVESFLEAEGGRRSPSGSPDSTLAGVAVESTCSSDDDCSGRRFSARRPSEEDEGICFGRLSFGDRRRLLEMVVAEIRIKMPALAQGPLISRPSLASKKELRAMTERHALLLWMYVHGDPRSTETGRGGGEATTPSSCHCHHHRIVDSECLSGKLGSSYASEDRPAAATATAATSTITATTPASKRSGFAGFLKAKIRQIVLRSKLAAQEGRRKNRTEVASPGAAPSRRLTLREYLRQGAGVGLRLEAASLKLTLYRAWPIICENRFALYKLPEQKAVEGRELAGLWGGTFGWPPGRPDGESKPGKPLFFLLLSYDDEGDRERDGGGGGRLLIATKILEGTHYVLHPNGSAMFTARVEEPSAERFPWESYRDGSVVETVECYQGEGISNGYGFRYPSSKPGALFVHRSGMLAFVWSESRAVLTLEKLDVEEMLRNGERVGALTPIANFAYHTKANSNVFAGCASH
ncbi:F-box protein At5g39450 [Selaginella moellendorffii]|uniref:F-box protein At5g39450 n=1 Tax=Selaginella moellendorffii TaxID=88036 RepID=UPI000D1CD070|nr:F-box protein At5g39450 [Selaginella moellendorffii]|eukprot:XP_024522473.1 F-box protein At5g39450 [Selaginella moellendorffii]